MLERVGGLNIYALEIGSLTCTVLSGLLPSLYDTATNVHPLLAICIGLLKLIRVLSVPELTQVQPKQAYFE